MVLNKRMEILWSEDEFESIKREAKASGVSFGEYVRDVVRKAGLQPSGERRRAAIDRILNDPQFELDVGSWEEAKQLIGRYVDKEPDA